MVTSFSPRPDGAWDTRRQPCAVEVVCHSAAGEADFPRPGVLCRASTAGLSIYTSHRFLVRERIVVEIPSRPSLAGGRRLAVMVVRAERAPVLGDWLFACAFLDRGLSDDEIRALTGTHPLFPEPLHGHTLVAWT